MANLYTTENGARTFTGVINPGNKENKILVLDVYEIDEAPRPKEINKYLFKVMEAATRQTNSIFNV